MIREIIKNVVRDAIARSVTGRKSEREPSVVGILTAGNKEAEEGAWSASGVLTPPPGLLQQSGGQSIQKPPEAPRRGDTEVPTQRERHRSTNTGPTYNAGASHRAPPILVPAPPTDTSLPSAHLTPPNDPSPHSDPLQRQERSKVQDSGRIQGLQPPQGQTPSAAPPHPWLLQGPHTLLLHQASATPTAGGGTWSSKAESGAWSTSGVRAAPPVSRQQSIRPPPVQYSAKHQGLHSPRDPGPASKARLTSPAPRSTSQTPAATPMLHGLLQPPLRLLLLQALATQTAGERAWSKEGGTWSTLGVLTAPPDLLQQSGEQFS